MACDQCQNGWIYVEREHGPLWARVSGDGWEAFPRPRYSAAQRCLCSIPIKNTVVPPSIEKIKEVVVGLSGVMPFFPKDDLSRKLITAEVRNFCDDSEKLQRWAREVMRYFTKWQGVGPLRALYCAMFRPADGVYVPITYEDASGHTQIGLPGYTEEELLARAIAEDEAQRTRETERLERLAIARGDERFPLPEAKRIA